MRGRVSKSLLKNWLVMIDDDNDAEYGSASKGKAGLPKSSLEVGVLQFRMWSVKSVQNGGNKRRRRTRQVPGVGCQVSTASHQLATRTYFTV